MKSIAFILSMLFLCSSLNLDAAVKNIFFESSACCSTKVENKSCETNSEEDKDGCCSNGECDCMCCATFIIVDNIPEEKEAAIQLNEEVFSHYNFHLQENSLSIFHPPLLR